MRYQLISAQFHELRLRKVLIFVGKVELVEVFLERALDELLGFLTHDVDLTDNPFVHLILAVDSFFGIKVLLLGDLTDFGTSLRTFFPVKWFFHILFSLSQLIGDVVLAFVTASELNEEVSHTWVSEEALLGLLAVLVHNITNDAEVDGKLTTAALCRLFLRFLDESVILRVPVREEDHHDPQDDRFLLVHFERGVVRNDIFTEEMIDKVLYNLVHLVFGQRLDGTILHVLVPSSWLLDLHFREPVFEERVELVFVKLRHRSEARSLEEKVKVLVVFGLLGPALFSSLCGVHVVFDLVFVIGIDRSIVELELLILHDHLLTCPVSLGLT